VWVAVRQHPQVPGSSNRLLKFDADGKPLLAIDLGQKSPFRLSVDGKDGSVWVAHFTLPRIVSFLAAAAYASDLNGGTALSLSLDAAGAGNFVLTPDCQVRRNQLHAGIMSGHGRR
jgi:hypothetical protein